MLNKYIIHLTIMTRIAFIIIINLIMALFAYIVIWQQPVFHVFASLHSSMAYIAFGNVFMNIMGNLIMFAFPVESDSLSVFGLEKADKSRITIITESTTRYMYLICNFMLHQT